MPPSWVIKLKEGWAEAKNAAILDDKAERGLGRGQKCCHLG